MLEVSGVSFGFLPVLKCECGDWSLSLLPMMMEIEFSRTDRETRSTPTFRRKRFARRGAVGGVGSGDG